MAWIELHQELVHHRKLYALAEELRVDRMQAMGHVTALWLWALSHAEDGDLSRFTDVALADAAQWHRNGPKFVAALRSAAFVDDERQLHDWMEYAGRLVEKRVKDRNRQRKIRESSKGKSKRQPADNPKVVAGNPTVPNQKTTTTTDSARAREREGQLDIIGLYEGLGWTVNAHTGQILTEIEAEFGKHPDWIVAAFNDAAKYRARNIAYVEAALKHWQDHGRDCTCRKGGANGRRADDAGADTRGRPVRSGHGPGVGASQRVPGANVDWDAVAAEYGGNTEAPDGDVAGPPAGGVG